MTISRAIYAFYINYVKTREIYIQNEGTWTWDNIYLFPFTGDLWLFLWLPVFMTEIFQKWLRSTEENKNKLLKEQKKEIESLKAKLETQVTKSPDPGNIQVIAAIQEVEALLGKKL